jgi:hypothetical protein
MPEKFHRELKSSAAREGLSVSDYLLKDVDNVAGRPTLKELAERIASRTPVKYKISPAEILREERGRRSSSLMLTHLGRQTPGLPRPEDH